MRHLNKGLPSSHQQITSAPSLIARSLSPLGLLFAPVSVSPFVLATLISLSTLVCAGCSQCPSVSESDISEECERWHPVGSQSEALKFTCTIINNYPSNHVPNSTWSDRIALPPKGEAGLSDCLHVLRVRGLESRVSQEPHSMLLLDAVTKNEVAQELLGHKTMFRTREGVRVATAGLDGVSNRAFESHRDQCLAEFAQLGLPLETSIQVDGRGATIRDLLRDSVANFYLFQSEICWTAVAYSFYLPPAISWTDKFGESHSFDDVAGELVRRPLTGASCAGTHRVYALTVLCGVDSEIPILSPEIRQQAEDALHEKVIIAVQNQSEDGSWTLDWASDVGTVASNENTDMTRLLVTGHVMEWMTILPDNLRPSITVLHKARRWLLANFRERATALRSDEICPYSHAAIALNRLAFCLDES